MQKISLKFLGVSLLLLLAASIFPAVALGQTGKIHHYVQSEAGGSQKVDLWVYFDKDRTEQFQLPQGSRRAILTVQTPDRLDVWEVDPERKTLFARIEPTGAEQARIEVFPVGRPAETIARPPVPWTLYFSFPALSPVFQKAGSGQSFEVSLATPIFAPGQAPIRFDGPITVSPAGEEERGGVRARKLRMARGQEEVGFAWIGPEGDLREAELTVPNEEGEGEPRKVVLRREGVEASDRAAWEKLRTAKLGSAPEEGPVEAKTVAPHPCKVSGLDEEVRCATYAVWEDRKGKKGRKIGLNIVVIPAVSKDKAADPIFFFGGGPGEGVASESAPGFPKDHSWRQKRDVVLIDQRGAGRSNRLQCAFYGEPVDYRKAAGAVFPVDAVKKCRERLEKVADLRFYTTALAADDFDEVRSWLGYGKVNLWGGSYGTQMAQVYLRRHPETVRSVVLVAVAPVNKFIPLPHAYAGKRAVEALLAECKADAACNAAFPNVRSELDAVLERAEKGISVTVTDTRTGERVEVRPDRGLLAEGIRFLMYGRGGGSLPLQIHRAYQGDLTPLVQMSIEQRLGINEALAMGLNFSVTCAEDLPYITDEMTKRETAGTLLRDYRVAAQKAVCENWPRGAVPADVHELVRSNVPVLLISGEWDPVTPPEFAESVAKTLPNSLHLVVPKGSHGGAGRCTQDLIQEFYDRASVQGLNASCLKEYPKPVFMLK